MDIDSWYSFIKRAKQEDIPMDFNGVIMTPKQYIETVKRGEDDVVALSERPPVSVFNLEKLLRERIEKRYAAGEVEEVYILNEGKYHWTPEEIIEEVRKGTPMGEKFLLMEKGLMDELKRRLVSG